MKHVYLWTALAIAALVTTIVLWHTSSLHYPRVVTTLPGNITLTFVEQPMGSEEKCVQKSEIVSAKIREKCPGCGITTSCPTRLSETETRALHGQAINLPVVHSALSITIIDTEEKTAMSICNSMAEKITKLKIQQANCIAPAKKH